MIKIEIEGTDGSGKTTALKYLIEQLKQRELEVLETREVGSPLIPTNVKLREIVLNPESNMSGEAMEMIFSAMRLENDRLYKKLGDEYDFIVSDRGWFSHLAYTDHNVSEEFTDELYMNFMSNYTDMPDVVVYLEVDGTTALSRRVRRGEEADVIELKGEEYQEKVRQSFDKYIKRTQKELTSKTSFVFIDATQDLTGVKSQIDEIVDMLISTYKTRVTNNNL